MRRGVTAAALAACHKHTEARKTHVFDRRGRETESVSERVRERAAFAQEEMEPSEQLMGER